MCVVRISLLKMLLVEFEEITGKIIGCAMKVHTALGNGFHEVIYQRGLAIEMDIAGITYQREMAMPVFYDHTEIETRRVDFFVEDAIMAELKAITVLEAVHLAQALNYLEAYKMRTGLLTNFGSSKLTFKRIFNNKLESQGLRSSGILPNPILLSFNPTYPGSDNG